MSCAGGVVLTVGLLTLALSYAAPDVKPDVDAPMADAEPSAEEAKPKVEEYEPGKYFAVGSGDCAGDD